uniref:Uncharacterized protein n=1 Tax=Romanomermis culicivorax TaxID=13658 RepID=A0A915KWL3_ROMCU
MAAKKCCRTAAAAKIDKPCALECKTSSTMKCCYKRKASDHSTTERSTAAAIAGRSRVCIVWSGAGSTIWYNLHGYRATLNAVIDQ